MSRADIDAISCFALHSQYRPPRRSCKLKFCFGEFWRNRPTTWRELPPNGPNVTLHNTKESERPLYCTPPVVIEGFMTFAMLTLTNPISAKLLENSANSRLLVETPLLL
jgi:hypothetical protein